MKASSCSFSFRILLLDFSWNFFLTSKIVKRVKFSKRMNLLFPKNATPVTCFEQIIPEKALATLWI